MWLLIGLYLLGGFMVSATVVVLSEDNIDLAGLVVLFYLWPIALAVVLLSLPVALLKLSISVAWDKFQDWF